MKILLAGGGSSRECEISLRTTDAMERATRELGYDVDRIDLADEMDVVSYWDDGHDLLLLGFHGRRGEDGLIQAYLDRFGIPYSGANAAGSALAFSKAASKRLFIRAGVPTPEFELHLHEPRSPLPETDLSYPYVIKPDDEGSTIGLSVCRNEDDYPHAQEVSGAFSRLIYEKFIPGRELTVGVLGKKALPVVEIFPGHELYDYESKYTKGLSRYECPADLDEAQTHMLQNLAIQAMAGLNIEVYGRVDFRFAPDGSAWCLEINTLPGMTETSLLPMGARAVGMSFTELVDHIIRESLLKY